LAVSIVKLNLAPIFSLVVQPLLHYAASKANANALLVISVGIHIVDQAWMLLGNALS
jgi:hypothetical protein